MNKSGRVVPKFNIGITDYKNIMGTHYSPNCKEIMDLAKREGQFGEGKQNTENEPSVK